MAPQGSITKASEDVAKDTDQKPSSPETAPSIEEPACRGRECRCLQESPEDLTSAQKRYLCAQDPNFYKKKQPVEDLESGVENSRVQNILDDDSSKTNEAKKNIPPVHDALESDEIPSDHQDEGLIATPPKIKCWDGCLGSFESCQKECGPGGRCWGRCLSSHQYCAEKCGPGQICRLRCEVPGKICDERCGLD